jgi:hypothetical protein
MHPRVREARESDLDRIRQLKDALPMMMCKLACLSSATWAVRLHICRLAVEVLSGQEGPTMTAGQGTAEARGVPVSPEGDELIAEVDS